MLFMLFWKRKNNNHLRESEAQILQKKFVTFPEKEKREDRRREGEESQKARQKKGGEGGEKGERKWKLEYAQIACVFYPPSIKYLGISEN